MDTGISQEENIKLSQSYFFNQFLKNLRKKEKKRK